MAVPTTGFKSFSRTKAYADLDTLAERIGSGTGWGSGGFTTVDTGANPLDFGTVDISGGNANSNVFYLTWKVTANGGNTIVDNFRVWNETSSPDYWGFTLAGTMLRMAPIVWNGSPTYGQNYVINATTGTYTWSNINTAGAPSQNAYPAGGTALSCNITTIGTTEDLVAMAMYLAVADNEITGTYQGTTSGKEFRGSFRYDYS